jgi:hypothetical protein
MSGESSVCWDRLLSSANPRLAPGPTRGLEIIAGRNGPTGGPKIDRPSPGATTPPPLLFRRSKGRSGFVSTERRRLQARVDYLRDGGKRYQALATHCLQHASSCPLGPNSRFVGAPGWLCLCRLCPGRFRVPGNGVDRSSRLALKQQPFNWYWWRKALATERFQYATSKRGVPPVPARRTDESEVYLWRMSSNECREK